MKKKEIFTKEEKKEFDKILKTSNFEKICNLLEYVLQIGAKRQLTKTTKIKK